MSMDTIRLKEKAIALLAILNRLSPVDSGARVLLIDLRPLLDASLRSAIQEPVDWKVVPGASQFRYGSLREHDDLEEAYAQFKIEVTGGEPLALKIFRASRNQGKDSM
jgi:hypothetical protein